MTFQCLFTFIKIKKKKKKTQLRDHVRTFHFKYCAPIDFLLPISREWAYILCLVDVCLLLAEEGGGASALTIPQNKTNHPPYNCFQY